MIHVVPYDPDWAHRFEDLKAEYTAVLRRAGVDVVAIEHVGSTSVPGLAAKPVIDCDIVVAADDVEPASRALVGLGFRPRGDLGIEQRWAFAPPARLAPTHTYVTVAGCVSLRNHLAVRDRLRSDPQLRDAYGDLKVHLARTARTSDEYVQGKSHLIQEILKSAGFTKRERESIGRAQQQHQPAPEDDDAPGLVSPSPHDGSTPGRTVQ